MKAHCCTFCPIPRKDRNLTRYSAGSLPSWNETDTVLGATATLTVLQSSLSVFSIMSLIAVLMTSMPPGLATWTLMLDGFIKIKQYLKPHLRAAQVPSTTRTILRHTANIQHVTGWDQQDTRCCQLDGSIASSAAKLPRDVGSFNLSSRDLPCLADMVCIEHESPKLSLTGLAEEPPIRLIVVLDMLYN